MSSQRDAFETVRAWWQAWVENDLATIARLTDPQYSEHRQGTLPHLVGFGDLLEEASRNPEGVSIKEWSLEEPATKTFEHTAVCNYAFRIAGHCGRKEFTFTGRATDVLVRRGDAWIYLSHHGTLQGSYLPPSQASESVTPKH
ncbi:MAG TPA: nuclear transport factor 2 family protein [Vicinamibacteria bacterium]|nr:nuclear transport factor 2 family protein [Vicinamibacteria bacterium]